MTTIELDGAERTGASGETSSEASGAAAQRTGTVVGLVVRKRDGRTLPFDESRIRAALATLPGDRTPTAKDWHRLSAGWHADLDARIEQLTRLRDHLTDCIGCGCLSLASCTLANPHDELGTEGPGARVIDVVID